MLSLKFRSEGRYTSKYIITISVLYVFASALISSFGGMTIYHPLYFIIPTLSFSLYNKSLGVLIGLLSLSIAYLSFYGFNLSNITSHPKVLYLVGAVVNTILAFLLGSIREIYIEQKNSETVIRESKAQYQRVVDNISEGMVILDNSGTVTFINRVAAEMLGLSVYDIGFNVIELFDDRSKMLFSRGLEKGFHGRPSEYEIVFNHPTRGVRKLFIAATHYTDVDGVVSGSLGFISDTTDTDKKDEDIKTLRMRNDYLIAEMDHRIGNSLSVVRSLINLYLLNDGVSNYIGLKRLGDIVDTMIYINSRVFSSFKRQTIDIGNLINSIIWELIQKYYYAKANVTVKADHNERHIDEALPFGLLFTIIVSNILQRLKKETQCRFFVMYNTNHSVSELTLALFQTETDKIKVKDILQSETNEAEIIEALIHQIKGKMTFNSQNEGELEIVF